MANALVQFRVEETMRIKAAEESWEWVKEKYT